MEDTLFLLLIQPTSMHQQCQFQLDLTLSRFELRNRRLRQKEYLTLTLPLNPDPVSTLCAAGGSQGTP